MKLTIIGHSDRDEHCDPAPSSPSLLIAKDASAAATETLGRRKDGSCFPIEMETSEMQIGERMLTIGCIRDISERKAYAEALEHQALHDPLTGLANRQMLSARLDQAIAQARTERTEVVLMLVDLDRFRDLNDTLGRSAGDQLLREIGPRLIQGSSRAELIARFGGDEFAVIVAPGTGAADAERIAEQLRDALTEPFEFDGLTAQIGAHVGIAIYPEHARDAEMLTRRAEIAMNSAKKHRVGHEIYDAAYDEHNRERLTLVSELPEAIASSELVLHYQPKYDLHDATITGVEALVRWQHPELGLLAPGRFLPLAEKTGLMRGLTHAVLNGALSQFAHWRAQNTELRVAVNLAGANLLDAALPHHVQTLLEKWGLPASSLQLEITETIVSNDPASVADALGQLRALGVTLSLDHFGIGSSSPSFLRQLPIQELKIDRSFVLEMNTDDHNAAVVHTIIDLAHDLGMWTVAEGIETQAVSDRLASFGCDQGQGFLLGRPMPADQLIALAGNLAATDKHD